MFRKGLIRSRRVVVVSRPCMVVGRHGRVSHRCHHCCRCVAASDASFIRCVLSQSTLRRCAVGFDTPSWCDGSLTATPPTVVNVHDEVAAVVCCLSVAVVALFSNDTVVRCLGCVAVGVKGLRLVDTDVRCLGCTAEGAEVLKDDEVEVVTVDCCTDGVEVLLFDDVADR